MYLGLTMPMPRRYKAIYEAYLAQALDDSLGSVQNAGRSEKLAVTSTEMADLESGLPMEAVLALRTTCEGLVAEVSSGRLSRGQPRCASPAGAPVADGQMPAPSRGPQPALVSNHFVRHAGEELSRALRQLGPVSDGARVPRSSCQCILVRPAAAEQKKKGRDARHPR